MLIEIEKYWYVDNGDKNVIEVKLTDIHENYKTTWASVYLTFRDGSRRKLTGDATTLKEAERIFYKFIFDMNS